MSQGYRNIFCIGRNYAEHAKELKNEVPKEPVVFLKPVSSLIRSGQTIRLPADIGRVDHEVEVVLRIGSKVAKNTPPAESLRAVSHYAVGIDVTGRDLQDKAKAKSLPWALAKGIDTFAPLSDFVPAAQIADPRALDLELRINGEVRQKGNTRDLLFPFNELIAYLSRFFSLDEGDLIFTGTPPGVGPIQPGDRLQAILGNGLAELQTNVERES